MKDWRGVIVLIEYMLQSEDLPLACVDMMCDAILKERGVRLQPQEVFASVAEMRKSTEDLSVLLKANRHSDRIIREFLNALDESLKNAGAIG